MCGIAGLVDFGRKTNLETLKKMTDVLFHRGPDDGGYFFEAFEHSQVGLGHRRLSILDLSNHGHQPMVFNHLTMVYNGEVYNFKEIRAELEKQGYSFESHSDTEVILKAYHKWGIEAVHHFNGMFAIAIFDNQAQTLTLIRDRAGVKPLYWYQKDGLFMFASELKSFHQHPAFVKELNNDGLALFLQYGYIPQPHTIFNHTHKLKAGHVLTLNTQNSQLNIEKYWDVIDCYNQPKLDISEHEALEETERLLKSACEYRMVADVPVGMFLSGGYDSSAVTALLQSERTEKLKTFAIGFHEEKFNEAHHAKKVAEHLGTDHTEYYCTQKDALEILPKLPEIWDEPFGDASAIPTTLVSQLARKNVTVSLSADGGDEVFGGYDKYNHVLNIYSKFSKIPACSFAAKLLAGSKVAYLPGLRSIPKLSTRIIRLAQLLESKNPVMAMSGLSKTFSDIELKRILKRDTGKVLTGFDEFLSLNSSLTDLDKLLAIDYKTYQLDDILTKVDRATMSVSLEGREPLLDFNIINFVAKLDPNLKIRNGNKKYLLKEITHKYLPKEIMDRPKMGFGVPIFDWFKDELKDYLMIYLDEQRLAEAGIFQPGLVVKIRDQYLNGQQTNINQLWFLLMFEMWREKWM
ncbi:asparagine synthase (glutamine-hydrolyzing) [Thiomicrospira sp. R3]|uniref:asparagine synthase (glutamine-hydrolyzing) n=1 Tax=Thiomicrospira sp. R3 TaxID=3035472 RepID=UPI00259AFE2D|nr:asparagine synthase (glutamine-hydrolyzing) [Thiomicrospira sp. R3]WFE68801.1 asparagine synthase (glutamine-hydrolyzing) [Thiomicrospira sp. R3]